MKRTFPVQKVAREILSPEAFLNLNTKEKSNVSFSEIIPARLGKPGFGKIMVHYKNTVYR